MKFVAFFRNVNLGQGHSPTRPQLEAAFLEAGASTAESFLTNGSVVFTAARKTQAQQITNRAGEILSRTRGLQEPAFIQSLRTLSKLAATQPFAPFADPLIEARFISFFPTEAVLSAPLPLQSARKDCLVFQMAAGVALSVTWAVKGHTGYPTPVLEKALGTPVTTRSWTTIIRLLEKHN